MSFLSNMKLWISEFKEFWVHKFYLSLDGFLKNIISVNRINRNLPPDERHSSFKYKPHDVAFLMIFLD